jgi:2-polyprenyl-6-methoxyphenol hydroxylase-like FAD-dependent oxidoreductase
MEHVETLIVGAGPVGLFLAAELRRRGRDCMIIESANVPSTHSKALALMPGTLEMFEAAKIADRFVAASNRIDGVRFVTPRRSVYVPFGSIDSAYNYVSILPQWKTQELLEARLRELGGEVLYGHTLTALTQSTDGVEATIERPAASEIVRARYVVGCDGVRSTVREQIGVSFEGAMYPGTVLLADAVLRTDVPANEARVHVHGGGVVTMFPMSASERRLVVIAPREALPERAQRERLQARLRTAGYGDVTIDEIEWSNSFRVQRRVASAMRLGRVFLAGDSVHAHSPVGGQGMNVGLRDAWNLAAKLAAVLSDEAPEGLLDLYERERLPVAKSVVRRTDLLTRALAHPHPLLRLTRERIAPRIARLPIVYGPVIRRLSLTA